MIKNFVIATIIFCNTCIANIAKAEVSNADRNPINVQPAKCKENKMHTDCDIDFKTVPQSDLKGMYAEISNSYKRLNRYCGGGIAGCYEVKSIKLVRFFESTGEVTGEFVASGIKRWYDEIEGQRILKTKPYSDRFVIHLRNGKWNGGANG
jgi:hypothetical protein